MPKVQTIVGLSLIALTVAFLFPAVMTAAEDGRTGETRDFTEGEVHTFQDAVIVETNNLNRQDVTVNVTSVQTGNATMFTLNDSETHTATLDGNDVNVTAVSLTADTATLTVNYPTDMGWDSQTRAFSEHLPIVIVIVGFVSIVIITGRMIQ